MEWKKDNFLVSDSTDLLNLNMIYELLAQTYWATNRPQSTIDDSIKHSLNFGLYNGNGQIGFARVITDYATLAWICDVVIHPEFRGQGWGKFLLGCIVEHPKLKDIKFSLVTKDAHSFYEQFGFAKGECMKRPLAAV